MNRYYTFFPCYFSLTHLILQIEHKLLRIPTGKRLTSWLFTQRSRGIEFGTDYREQIQIAISRVEELNQGPPDFKSSTLNHSATLPHLKMLQKVSRESRSALERKFTP